MWLSRSFILQSEIDGCAVLSGGPNQALDRSTGMTKPHLTIVAALVALSGAVPVLAGDPPLAHPLPLYADDPWFLPLPYPLPWSALVLGQA